MDLLQSFKNFVVKEQLFSSGDGLLLAVSGGMDSVVLCDLCHRAGHSFVIAHANFQLRGPESERDEEFVRGLAAKYGAAVAVKRFDAGGYAAEKKVSIQVAARELRYDWFRELVGGERSKLTGGDGSKVTGAGGASTAEAPIRIVTAHHLDDNIETLLMNFFKGTGIAGLHGILPKQGVLVRPLLFVGKDELRQYAIDRQLDWVEDSSNQSDKYTRNYFRHQVIPLVERVYPGAVGNLAENITRFRETERLYRQSVEQHKAKLLERRGDEIHIPVLKLKKAVPLQTIVFEIIHEFGFSPGQVEEVMRLLDSGSGKYIVSPSHRILKNRNWLILSPHREVAEDNMLIEGLGEGKVCYAGGELQLQLVAATPNSSAPNPLEAKSAQGVALLDAATIQFPLLLRKWGRGDYFYPLGLRKKKKLGRFFIDNKLSLADKEKVWVLEMDKKIVWVVGWRIDDRFKIGPGTKEILRIELGDLNP